MYFCFLLPNLNNLVSFWEIMFAKHIWGHHWSVKLTETLIELRECVSLLMNYKWMLNKKCICWIKMPPHIHTNKHAHTHTHIPGGSNFALQNTARSWLHKHLYFIIQNDFLFYFKGGSFQFISHFQKIKEKTMCLWLIIWWHLWRWNKICWIRDSVRICVERIFFKNLKIFTLIPSYI